MPKVFLFLAAAVLIVTSCGIISSSKVSNALYNAATNTDKTYTFKSLPQNVEELKALPEADMKDPYAVAALTVVALMRYETSLEDCYAMLNYLKGPEELSPYEKSFLRDRFAGNKYYKVRSFFAGSSPQNDYTPSQPYKIKVHSNAYSFPSEDWATLWLASSGADNARSIKLRQKKSTAQWFLNEIQILSDIREPASADPWN